MGGGLIHNPLAYCLEPMGAHSIMGDICSGGIPFTTELSAKEKRKVGAGIPLSLSRACLLASRPYFLKVMSLPSTPQTGNQDFTRELWENIHGPSCSISHTHQHYHRTLILKEEHCVWKRRRNRNLSWVKGDYLHKRKMQCCMPVSHPALPLSLCFLISVGIRCFRMLLHLPDLMSK